VCIRLPYFPISRRILRVLYSYQPSLAYKGPRPRQYYYRVLIVPGVSFNGVILFSRFLFRRGRHDLSVEFVCISMSRVANPIPKHRKFVRRLPVVPSSWRRVLSLTLRYSERRSVLRTIEMTVCVVEPCPRSLRIKETRFDLIFPFIVSSFEFPPL